MCLFEWELIVVHDCFPNQTIWHLHTVVLNIEFWHTIAYSGLLHGWIPVVDQTRSTKHDQLILTIHTINR